MIDLTKLWNARPLNVQRKVSLHDLRQTVHAYNLESPESQSAAVRKEQAEVRGNFLPQDPTQFDYFHAIRAVASRVSNKQISNLADAGMRLSDVKN